MALVVTKTFSPDPINVGGATVPNGVSTLTITIQNTDPIFAVFGVSFLDTYPAGVVTRTPSNLFSDAGGVASAPDGGNFLSLSGGLIPGNATATITVEVIGTTAGVKNNSTGIVSSTAPVFVNPGASDTLTVLAATPTLDTQASPSVVIGGAVSDSATLQLGVNPTGTITFDLHGPNDATCSTVPIFSSTVPVAGNGNYASASFVPPSVGTYRWIANYSGDANNSATLNVCNEFNEQVDVFAATPTLDTQASPTTTPLGGAVQDTAVLSGGFNPTGTITFDLYGPNDGTCSTVPIFSSTVPVAGNGNYVSASFVPPSVGTYRWIANYSGDANNSATLNVCGELNEEVLVSNAVTPSSNGIGNGGGGAGFVPPETIPCKRTCYDPQTGLSVPCSDTNRNFMPCPEVLKYRAWNYQLIQPVNPDDEIVYYKRVGR